MNKIIKSIKRTTAMIATLAVGIITLPTLLANNETSINPIASIALANAGDYVDVETYSVSQPGEVDSSGLTDGPENWYRSGLKDLGSYCINAGWASGNKGGLSIEELNKIIRNNQEIVKSKSIKTRTYYRGLKVHDSDLKTFEKYALSFPRAWYSREMQQIMWALAGDPDSVLSQYGGNSKPVEAATLMYENSNEKSNTTNDMEVNKINPNEIYEKYINLTKTQKPNKEDEIKEYTETINQNEARINTLNTEIQEYYNKLTELDPNWQSVSGADSLKITTSIEIKKEGQKVTATGETLEEAKRQAQEFIEREKTNLATQLNEKMDELETVVKEILTREASIWTLKNTNENIEKVRIPKANAELEEIKGNISDLEDAFGGGKKLTLDSIKETLKDIQAAIVKARTVVDEGKKYAEFYEKMKKQANGGELSLNLVNKTDVTKVKTIVDQENYDYIVGPFELDYISGDYGSVTFGGITKLELEGYTNETIPIEGLIIDELSDGDLSNDTWINKDDIHYFTPSQDEHVDRKQQTYPKPGKKFYVRFSDPKNGKNEAAIKGIKASVDWLECDAQVAVYEAITYTLQYKKSRKQMKYLGDDIYGQATYEANSEVIWYKPGKVIENHEHQQHEATPSGTRRNRKKVTENGPTETVTIKAEPKNIEPITAIVDLLQENGEEKGPSVNWIDAASNRSNKELEIMSEGDGGSIPLTMNIGGRVWVDKPVGKLAGTTSGLDGKRTEGEDEDLPGVEVILHNYTLEKEREEEVIAHSYNYKENNFNYNGGTPILCKTVTDEEGKYFFTGLKPQYKYYVEFIYNGEIYEPTYFTDNFETDYSHATDTVLTRKNFNYSFETIDPANECYTVKRPLAELGFTQGSKNKVYSLWRYSNNYSGTTDRSGNSIEESMRSKNGIREIYEDLIMRAAKYAHDKDSTKQNNAYKLAYNEMLSTYASDPEIKNKLQFIEDCKLEDTFSGYHNGDKYTSDTTHKNKGLYPQYDKFVIGDKTISIGKLSKSDQKATSIPPVYPSILGIDLGLYERDTGDINVSKSIVNAEVSVNEKYQKYNYKDRTIIDSNGDGIEDEWEIELRAADYGLNNYYQQEYTREIRPSDYLIDNNGAGTSTDTTSEHYKRDQLARARAEALGVKGNEEQELKVFVTYKIKVKNQSQRIIMVPNEINDYFDKSFKLSEFNYEYKNNTYESKGSTYSVNESGEKYKTLTIKDDTLLAPGASIEYKIKFEVLKAEDKENEMLRRIILGEKENLVEVMKYSSYYPDNYEIPDEGTSGKLVSIIYGEPNPAFGAIDVDSTPGNLNPNSIDMKQLRSLTGDEYTNKVKELFEDDSDMAQGFNITLTDDEDDQRTIQGLVFEDNRQTSNNDLRVSLGDGQLGNDDTTINGVTVQLVELKNNKEFIIREFGSDYGEFYDYSDMAALYNRLSGINADTLGEGSGKVQIEKPIIKIRRPSSDNKDTTIGDELVNDFDLGSDYYKGKFVFHAFPAGEYEVRFIYGNTIKTVLVNKNSNDANEDAKRVSDVVELSGENSKSYTGNDYKSTIYQKGMNSDYNQEDQFTDYIYDIATSNSYPTVSDAKDVWEKSLYNLNDKHGSRQYVIDYSDNELINERAEILASATSLQRNGNDEVVDIKGRLDTLMKETYMRAETGKMNIEIENYSTNVNELGKDNQSDYKIDHIFLGLTERPKSQIKLEKEVENVVVTLADGTVLFDANGTMPNVTWKNNSRFKDYNNNENKLAIKDNNGYVNTIKAISKARVSMAGLVNLYMDEELMHGAQIRITYRIIATNIGEVDFSDKEFYYTGIENNPSNNIVKTKVNDIFDFVPNNLQFTAGMNTGVWEVAEESLRIKDLNDKVRKEEQAYNTIVHMADSNNIKKVAFVPELFTKTSHSQGEISTASDLLVLTTTMSPESASDTLTYDNIATLVNSDNTVGRRHQFSVAGNGSGLGQYLFDIATAKAETVTVLPPFGQTDRTILIVSAVAGILVIIGLVVFIIRRKTAK